jgi:hypothetical protein
VNHENDTPDISPGLTGQINGVDRPAGQVNPSGRWFFLKIEHADTGGPLSFLTFGFS